MRSVKTSQSILAGTAIALLLVLPFSTAYAQETQDTPSSEPVSDATIPSAEAIIEVQDVPGAGIEIVPQNTITADLLMPSGDPTLDVGNNASAQETIPSDTLVQTENPSDVPGGGGGGGTPIDPETPPEVIDIPDVPTEEATTTPILPDETPIEGIPVVEEELPADVPPEEIVDSIPMEDISPKEGFKFTIKSQRIPTTDAPDWQVGDEVISKTGKILAIDKTADITDRAQVSVNATTNTLRVSGSCSMTYFVILLYKNQTDYDTDPAAYILNRAFPCVDGKYAYSVDELPPTLENGTYYLLVGEMGDRGSWTPITSLVPITISAL